MATIEVTRNYEDGEVLTKADLDAPFDDIESFLNTTKINDDNIQNNGITGSTKLLNQSVTNAKLAADAVTTLKIADQNVTTAKVADEAITLAKIADEIMRKLTPPGTIIAYVDPTPPSGYLYCDGTAVSRTDYAALYAIIGTKFGYGDNSSTFNLPDLRGMFLRGYANGQSTDPDRSTRTAIKTGGNTGDAVGSAQPYATARSANTAMTTDSQGAHTHSLVYRSVTGPAEGGFLAVEPKSTAGGVALGRASSGDITATSSVQSSGAHTHTITGGGDNETRPRNVNVAYMIKY